VTRTTQVLATAWLVLTAACAPAVPATQVEEIPPSPAPTATAVPAVPDKIKVGVTSLLTHAPLYIAQEAGYYEEQGLDVELVSFGARGGTEILAALIQSQIDVAATAVSSGMINGIGEGGGIKIVADKGFYPSGAPCSDAAVMARTELLESGALEDPDSLRGLTTRGGGGATISELMISTLLAEHGLTLADMKLIDMDFATSLEAFKTDSLDIAVMGEPWITRARLAGAAEVWAGGGELLPNYSSGVLAFSPDMLARDPDVGIRFMTAYLQGVRKLEEGKTDENVAVIAGYTQLDPAEVSQLCWPEFEPTGTVHPEFLVEFQQWLSDVGHLNAILPVEEIWDPQYVDGAIARLGG